MFANGALAFAFRGGDETAPVRDARET